MKETPEPARPTGRLRALRELRRHTRPTPSTSVATPGLWAATVAGVLALLVVDFLLTRRPHEVSMREALGWSAFYVALPLAFGGWLW